MENEEAQIDSGETEVEETEDTNTLADQGDDGEGQAEAEENQAEDGKKDGFEPFPKKAKNAIARRDREIAKLKAQVRNMQASQQTAMQQQQQSPKQQGDGAPKEEDFDNYADFLRAQIMHDVRQEMGANTKAQEEATQKQQKETQQQQFIAAKSQEIAKQVQAHSKTIPDIAEVIDEYSDLLDYIPPEIEQVFFAADDTALAFYNIAKAGRLADVMQMTPYQAAIEIAKAQMQIPSKPTTPPPLPIRGAKGTGKPTKALADLEGDALLERLSQLAS